MTTTHGDPGGGDPRLVMTGAGAVRFMDDLDHPGIIEIPLGPAVDLGMVIRRFLEADAGRVNDVRIVQDGNDEFGVVDPHQTVTLNGAPAHGLTLHTGDRLEIAGLALIFQRDESHDHGRPFGGRQGGEFSDQPRQPDRDEVGVPSDAGPAPTSDPSPDPHERQ